MNDGCWICFVHGGFVRLSESYESVVERLEDAYELEAPYAVFNEKDGKRITVKVEYVAYVEEVGE